MSNFETDSSDVKGNTVTLNDNAYISNGSLILDSLSDYLQVTGDSTNVTIGNNSFVMEAFFSTDDVYNIVTSYYPYIMANEDGSGGTDVGFTFYHEPTYASGSEMRLVTESFSSVFTFDEALFQANVIHHIAIVGNSTHIYFYFDGSKVATGSLNYNFIYNQVNLGGNLETVGFNRPPGKKFYAARLTIGSTRGYEGASITVPSDPFIEN